MLKRAVGSGALSSVGIGSAEDLLVEPAVRGVLSEARKAYVVLDRGDGPHVTPELFSTRSHEIGFLVAASTVKARVLRRRPQIGVTVIAGTRAVVMGGTAAVLDVLDPATVLLRARHMPAATILLPAFILRNAADLAGFVRDFACGRLGFRLPGRRVLIVTRPNKVAFLEGASVVAAAGPWQGSVQPVSAVAVAPGGDAVVGWRTPDGPLALPGRWDPTETRVQVPQALVELAGAAGQGPACVVVDEYGGAGPAPKRGLLQRGTGTLVIDPAGAWVRIDAERVTTWRGVDIDTVSVSQPARSTQDIH